MSAPPKEIWQNDDVLLAHRPATCYHPTSENKFDTSRLPFDMFTRAGPLRGTDPSGIEMAGFGFPYPKGFLKTCARSPSVPISTRNEDGQNMEP